MIKEFQYDLLVELLEWYDVVSQDLRKALRPLLKVKEYQSTQIIKHAGEREKYVWFILSGYMRFIRPANGKYAERTVRFSFPGSITSEGNPFSSPKTNLDIEVLKGSLLVQIEISALLNLSAQFEELERMANAIEDNAIGWDLIESRCKKAKDKKTFYQEYKSDHPDLFLAYPHEQILDYLRICDNSYC